MAISNTVSNNSQNSYHMVGTEMIHMPFTPSATSGLGTVVFNKIISCKLAPRLELVSKGWLNWEPRSITVSVVPLNGSTVEGGVVVAYIDDPGKPVPTNPSDIMNLTAYGSSSIQQSWVKGGVTQSKTRPQRLLYTHHVGTGDVRLTSPGQVIAMLTKFPGAGASWALVMQYDIMFYNKGIDTFGMVPDAYNVSFLNSIVRYNPANGIPRMVARPVLAQGSEALEPGSIYLAEQSAWRPKWAMPESAFGGMNDDDEITGFMTPGNLDSADAYRFVIGPVNQRVSVMPVTASYSFEMFAPGVFFKKYSAMDNLDESGNIIVAQQHCGHCGKDKCCHCNPHLRTINEMAAKISAIAITNTEHSRLVRGLQTAEAKSASLDADLARANAELYRLKHPVQQQVTRDLPNRIVKDTANTNK